MHKQFVPRLVSIVTATTAIMWMSGVALPSAQRSETEGIKEAENFVSAGSDTVGAVGKARVQIEKTLAAYNSLVTQPTKDMKGDYKKLMNGAKETDQRVDEARERVTKMEAAGDVYFAGREAAIKEIQSQELREKARQRLDENKKQYAGVKASLQDAGQSLQTLRSDLKNQITYLGSDLTPSAMTSLKPQAQKFNARGTEVLTKVDQSMATANKYFDSMRPTKS
jgi:DNA repair ATPase RecN